MQTYEPMCGSSLHGTATDMVALANETDDTVVAKFNDIEIRANPCEDIADSVAVIVAYYKSESERRAEAYRNSPEGKQAAAKAKKRKQLMQSKMDEAMTELPTLDFSNLVTLVNWLEKVRDPSDHIDVYTPGKEIVSTFRKHGFIPNVNCGKDYDGEDEENFARWLIGQALDNLKSVGAIHQVFHRFAEEWRKEFGHA